MYHKEIVIEMKRLREKRYSPGKKKLKVMLDKFCEREDIPKVSISTIGRILKKKKYFYNQCCQARHSYHTATGKWARKRQWREKRKRRRYHPQPKSFGDIESFNRSLRKECLGWRKYKQSEITSLNQELQDYSIWYHNKRPHMSLNMQTPNKFIQSLPDF